MNLKAYALLMSLGLYVTMATVVPIELHPGSEAEDQCPDKEVEHLFYCKEVFENVGMDFSRYTECYKVTCKDQCKDGIGHQRDVPCWFSADGYETTTAHICSVKVCTFGCVRPDTYGLYCVQEKSCHKFLGHCYGPAYFEQDKKHGKCHGQNGNGLCDQCKEGSGSWGPNCDKAITCNLDHGTCDMKTCQVPSISGGGCSTCDANHFGHNCDKVVTCSKEFGTCNDGSCYGPMGDGHCSTTCTSGMGGKDCTCALSSGGSTTSCCHPLGSSTLDPDVDGKCTCRPGFYSALCNLFEENSQDIDSEDFLTECIESDGIMQETSTHPICVRSGQVQGNIDFRRVVCSGRMMSSGNEILAEWGFNTLSTIVECQQQRINYDYNIILAIEQTLEHVGTFVEADVQSTADWAELEITAAHLRKYGPPVGDGIVVAQIANARPPKTQENTRASGKSDPVFFKASTSSEQLSVRNPVSIFRATGRSSIESESCYLAPCPCGQMIAPFPQGQKRFYVGHNHCVPVQQGPRQELEVYASYIRCGMIQDTVATQHSLIPKPVFLNRAAYCIRSLEAHVGNHDGFGQSNEIENAYVHLLSVVETNLVGTKNSRMENIRSVVTRLLETYRERYSGGELESTRLGQMVPPYAVAWYKEKINNLVDKIREVSNRIQADEYATQLTLAIERSKFDVVNLLSEMHNNNQESLNKMVTLVTKNFATVHKGFQKNAEVLVKVAESERKMLEDAYEAERLRLSNSGKALQEVQQHFMISVEKVSHALKKVVKESKDVAQAQVELDYVQARTFDVLGALGSLMSVVGMFSPLAFGAGLALTSAAPRSLAEETAGQSQLEMDRIADELAKEFHSKYGEYPVEEWKLLLLAELYTIVTNDGLSDEYDKLSNAGLLPRGRKLNKSQTLALAKETIELTVYQTVASNVGRILDPTGKQPEFSSDNNEETSNRRLFVPNWTRDCAASLSAAQILARNTLQPAFQNLKAKSSSLYEKLTPHFPTLSLIIGSASLGLGAANFQARVENVIQLPAKGQLLPPIWSNELCEILGEPDITCYTCLAPNTRVCLNVEYDVTGSAIENAKQYFDANKEVLASKVRVAGGSKELWVPACLSTPDLVDLIRANLDDFKEKPMLEVLEKVPVLCGQWNTTAFAKVSYTPERRLQETEFETFPGRSLVESQSQRIQQLPTCCATCSAPNDFGQLVNNVQDEKQVAKNRNASNKQIFGAAALTVAVGASLFAIGSNLPRADAAENAEKALGKLDKRNAEQTERVKRQVHSIEQALREPFDNIAAMLHDLELVTTNSGVGITGLSKPVANFDAAAKWQSAFHSILNMLEYELGICPRTSPLKLGDESQRNLRSVQEDLVLRRNLQYRSIPRNSKLSKSVQSKEYTKEDAQEKLRDEQSELRSAYIEQEKACNIFRGKFKELTIWAQSTHEGVIKMTEIMRKLRHVEEKAEAFNNRVASAEETYQHTLLAAFQTEEVTPLRNLGDDDTIDFLQGSSAAVQASLMDEEVLEMIDMTVNTLESYCNAHAYVSPKDSELMAELCNFNALDPNPLKTLVELGDKLSQVKITLEEEWQDLVYSKQVTSPLDFLDVTEMIDLQGVKENGFSKPFVFSLKGPLGGTSLESQGNQTMSSFHRGGPYFCKNDNVELHELGFLFLDKNGKVLGPPPAEEVTTIQEVSMDITLSGPFIKTLNGKEYVYELRPFTNIPYSYLLPDKDLNCGFVDSQPFFQDKACRGKTIQSINNLRPSPYSTWEVQLTSGHSYLKETERVILVASYSGIKDSEMLCRPNYSPSTKKKEDEVAEPETSDDITGLVLGAVFGGAAAVALAAVAIVWLTKRNKLSGVTTVIGSELGDVTSNNPMFNREGEI